MSLDNYFDEFQPIVYNIHIDKEPVNFVNIMRPNKYGNPFILGKDGNRDEVLVKYYDYVMADKELIAEIKRDLKGKNLLCCCHPKKCHGHVLAKIANE
jgi:hypothetical protein